MFMRKRILLLILILLLGFLTACNKPVEKDPIIPDNKEFTVSFVTSSADVVSDQIITSGEKVNLPSNPSKGGYVFRYWYNTDKNTPYDFNSEVTANITLQAYWGNPDVTLDNSKSLNFSNLTTEFDVKDGKLTLYFENNGNVPYVSIVDYFNLLANFIDTDIDFTFTENENLLTIFYQYYDEDEDETYDLELSVDLKTNLITANDPGFFWAYIYETETNYGRNIEYLYDYELNEQIGGKDVIYNLNEYKLDLVYFDEKVVAPFYLVNQLFAGSSYYNVYYNGDNLYGIYGQVSTSDTEYRKIRQSSKNNTDVPRDLVEHNYNVLAFNLDYFYGLKEHQNLKNFYSVLSPYYSNLMSDDYKKSAQALADLLLKTIDEPHTSYGFSGYHAPTSYNPPTNNLANYGERFNSWYRDGLYAIDDIIAAKWKISATTSWAANSPKRPDYWFIDDNSAVISFDSFTTKDIEETNEWLDKAYKDVFEDENILPSYTLGNRYFVYNQSDKKDKKTETLIWMDDTTDFITSYTALLLEHGFVHTEDETNKYLEGYYKKEIGDKTYIVVLASDPKNKLGYIGMTTTLPKTSDKEALLKPNITNLIESDSAIYLEMMIQQIKKEKPNIKNIGLDLTFNTGGNVGALYRIVGLMTDKPFGVSSYNRSSDTYQTTYITTDYDSYTEYDFFLLTSYVTFSAANQLTTIFKQNNIGIIIGQKTGGGASSITPILLPDGTFFTMSSNNINCIRTAGGEYIFNEDGIEPDYVIAQNELFNESVLAGILN